MMTALLALSTALGSSLPLDTVDERSVGVVISLAVNLQRGDLDRTAAGLELALARATKGLALVRVQPEEVSPGCGSDPRCALATRARLGVDEVWFLVLARVGDEVRLEGTRWSDGGERRAIAPFIVPRDQLGEPGAYGAPPDLALSPAAASDAPGTAVSADGAAADGPRISAATWILAGVAGGALGVGIGLGVAASDAESAARARGCGADRACPSDADRVQQLAGAADVLYGVAAASAASAAVAFVLSRRDGDEGRASTLRGQPVRGGLVVVWGGRF